MDKSETKPTETKPAEDTDDPGTQPAYWNGGRTVPTPRSPASGRVSGGSGVISNERT